MATIIECIKDTAIKWIYRYNNHNCMDINETNMDMDYNESIQWMMYL